MNKSKKNWIIIGVTILAILMIVRIAIVANQLYYHQQPQTNNSQTLCPSVRDGEFCTEEYNPVCGWYDPSKIQCIRYPCAQTYSNGCFACLDKKVKYFTKGECPKN